MSKKKRRKAGLPKVACPACGSKLKGRDVACRRCGHQRSGSWVTSPGAAKAVFTPDSPGGGSPAFLAKSAGGTKQASITPITVKTRRTCRNGCPPGPAGHSYCTRCGERYGSTEIEHRQHLLKGAGLAPSGYWGEQYRLAVSEAEREACWDLAYRSGETRLAKPGHVDAEAIAKASGYADLYDAVINEPNGSFRDYYSKAYFGSGGPAA